MVVSAGLISESFRGQLDPGEWDVDGVGLSTDSDRSHKRGLGDLQRGRIYPLMYRTTVVSLYQHVVSPKFVHCVLDAPANSASRRAHFV